MRVWTIQHKSYLKVLKKESTISGSLTHIKDLWDHFIPAYTWMVDMMNKRGINQDKSFPVWVWNKRPDKRLLMFNYAKKNHVMLELEIPDDQILWSNFDDWHCVLNSVPLFTDKNQHKKMKYFKNKYGSSVPNMDELDQVDQEKEYKEWEDIFIKDIKKVKKYTQGCVKNISYSQIVKVIG